MSEKRELYFTKVLSALADSMDDLVDVLGVDPIEWDEALGIAAERLGTQTARIAELETTIEELTAASTRSVATVRDVNPSAPADEIGRLQAEVDKMNVARIIADDALFMIFVAVRNYRRPTVADDIVQDLRRLADEYIGEGLRSASDALTSAADEIQAKDDENRRLRAANTELAALLPAERWRLISPATREAISGTQETDRD